VTKDVVIICDQSLIYHIHFFSAWLSNSWNKG